MNQAPLEAYSRDSSELLKHFAAHKIPFDLPKLILGVKEAAVELCKHVMRQVVREVPHQSPETSASASSASSPSAPLLAPGAQQRPLLEKAVHFAFRCHQFAGGFDAEANALFAQACSLLETCLAQS